MITKSIKGQKNSNQKQKNYEKPSIEDFQKLLNSPKTPSKEQKKGNHSNVNMDDVWQDNNQMSFLKEYNNKQNKTNTNNKKVDFDLIKNSKQENTNISNGCIRQNKGRKPLRTNGVPGHYHTGPF